MLTMSSTVNSNYLSGRSTSGRVATNLGATQVLFDDTPAPLIYASLNQIACVVPYDVAANSSVQVRVQRGGVPTNSIGIQVGEAAPAIFAADSSGSGQGAILNSDGTYNNAQSPAARGSYIVFYATGEGQTDPAGIDGLVAGSVLPKPRLPVRVLIGEMEATILYVGAAPGAVSGALQVNAIRA
jgi:uncharacterized protein (TIGR03437 family)